ncbi:carnosine N-methyltransferase [Acrasis kona]|uniref:carnosine N-methyltransferase n=1 Tax=Acrasis kona TaxID=1008807 RepID=A0AAW2ZJI8_9EUKA
MSQFIPGAADLSDEYLEISEDDRLQEEKHFATVLNAFSKYEQVTFSEINSQLKHYESINPQYLNFLKDYKDRFRAVKHGAIFNYNFFAQILGPHLCEEFKFDLDDGVDILHMNPRKMNVASHQHDERTGPEDIEKVHSTLKQFVRDWSEEGSYEREKCYGPIIAELENIYAQDKRSEISVLTPGSGLGRLSWEIARRGFKSQGNEFSYYMLLSANYILNFVKKTNHFKIFPFIHQRSNNFQKSDPVRCVTIPDVNPSSLPKHSDFSMVAGDFLELYNDQPDQWDCIVTCFFLDTARNVFEYIECIHRALKKGGIWINLGPLLYHYAESYNSFSIELSYDDVKKVIIEMGFELVKEGVQNCTYTTNKKSMMALLYKSVMFTAKKITDKPKTDAWSDVAGRSYNYNRTKHT